MKPNDPAKPLTERDFTSARQSLHLLRSQALTGSIEPDFFARQLAKIEDLMDRVEAQQHQSRRGARFEALYNVSHLLGASLDLQTVLNQVMDAIISLTQAERGFLMLRDDDGGLTVKAARNLDQQTLSGDEFKFSRTITNGVLDSGRPIVTTNAAEDPRFAGQMSIISQSLRSIMAAPLRARGGVIGVVYVDNRIIAGLFSEDDLAALEALSSQAAVALDNALLYSATDQELALRVEELQQLRRMDLLLNETLDMNRVMQYTLDWACRLSGAEVGHLGLVEGDPPTCRAVLHSGASPADQPAQLETLYPEVHAVMADGRTLLTPASDGRGGALIVPIHREQRVSGVVVLRQGAAGHGFTPQQREFIERLLARAAVAIENARLYAAVQAADRAKSEFVGIVAHDLKAPMTSISGYAELMLMTSTNLTERQAKFLNTIRSTVHRMEVLVSDLSDISRIESGHFYMDEIRVAVPDIIQAVKDGTLPQIEARGHHLREEVEPNLPEMWVDYYRLLQVLTNLMTNAYKYTPNGGTITLRAARAGDRVAFTVRDTGVGLTDEGVARLLAGTRFWRAEDDFTRSQPGTGLGFAITRALVEQMGSAITIDSAPGRGSAFSFSVAIARA